MPTSKIDIGQTWTALGGGPLSVAIDRGRTWFWQGNMAPDDLRCGFLLSAQGQQRLASFSKPDQVWARAADDPVRAIVITGNLASAAAPTTLVFQTYADLPDPTTLQAGQFAIVTDDPNDGLNGMHAALGNAPGQPAQFWLATS